MNILGIQKFLEKPIGILGFLFFVTLISRLSSFFNTDIDWDESTFILLGQSVLNGHLPYTDLLDVKPPLLWYCFAVLIFIAGKSFIFIRFLGSFLVTITAFLNYLIATKIWNKQVGLISALLLIFLINIISSGQAIMSEHLALLPLMFSFTLIIFKPNNFLSLYLSAFFLSAASMIRLNLLYVVLFVGLFLCIEIRNNWHEICKRSIAYLLGFVSFLSLMILPYIFLGEVNSLYTGLIKASLGYSEQGDLLSIVSRQIIPLIIFIITLFLVFQRQTIAIIQTTANAETFAKRFRIIFILFFIGIEISILRSGVFYDHYSIQFLPALSLFYAPFLNQFFIQRKSYYSDTFVFLVIIIVSIYLCTQYIPLTKRYLSQSKLMYGESSLVADYLKQANPGQQPVWLTRNQLAYWLAGLNPIIPSVAHPSNINKLFLLKAWYGENASTLTEFQKILEKKPVFIVIKNADYYFTEEVVAQNLLIEILSNQYSIVKNISEKQIIYKRNSVI